MKRRYRRQRRRKALQVKIQKEKICPRCRELKLLTDHHIIPSKLKTGINEIYKCCRECHNIIEKEILRLEHILLRENLTLYWRALNNCLRR